jgi:hypothetical protein
MSNENVAIFIIIDDEDLNMYYAGISCGCEVWKGHVSRAAIFDHSEAASAEIKMNNITGSKVVEIAKWW